ncbi:hypothetical protein PORCRE_1892 [Porphyromonas crevioricanis JCM 15906]|uniref:Exported 24-amino acid repeat protein n=2 Tax=Porphyromonas crevioricanis TaxID=393921 RepID=T1DTE6_9PORP|nr:hypothetical protein PORCRE_1892 [Porphyromonas crevioricanis JCM 15906]SKA06738.1 hypothetical protein SAMN02745203_01769 [Porphyromonas crevioricanis]
MHIFLNIMRVKSRLLCLIILLLGSISKIEAQKTLTKEELNDSTYTCRLDGVYILMDKTRRTILSFKNGKKHGQWVTFDTDLSFWVQTFENGKRQGLFSSSTIYGGVFGYYDNDQKEGYWCEVDDEGNYHKGQRTEIWKCYDHNHGELWMGSYKRGLKDGVWVCYDINNSERVIAKEIFRMGVLENSVTFEH